MDRGSITLDPSRSPVIPPTQEDITIPPLEAILTIDEIHETIVALGMAMGMEETTIRTIPLHPHPPREIWVTLLVSSAGRLDIMPQSVLKARMEMATEAKERSPTLSPEDK